MGMKMKVKVYDVDEWNMGRKVSAPRPAIIMEPSEEGRDIKPIRYQEVKPR